MFFRFPRLRHRGPVTPGGASVAIAIAIGLALVPASPALAADPGSFTWGVQPSGPAGPGDRDAFTYEARPGQTIHDTVAVSNLGPAPLTLALSAADARNAADGGFALLGPGEVSTGLGSWIVLAADRITIEQGTRADVPFALTVPADAGPGDHAAGVIAQAIGDTNDSAGGVVSDGPGGPGMVVQRRVGARVHLRVAGPVRPAVQVEQLDLRVDGPAAVVVPAGRAELAYVVRNVGNTRVRLRAEARLLRPGGGEVARAGEREVTELLPRGELRITEKFDGLGPSGHLTAEVRVAAVDGSLTAVRTTSAWVPSALPFILAAGAGLAGMGVVIARRRRQSRSDPVAVDAAPAGLAVAAGDAVAEDARAGEASAGAPPGAGTAADTGAGSPAAGEIAAADTVGVRP